MLRIILKHHMEQCMLHNRTNSTSQHRAPISCFNLYHLHHLPGLSPSTRQASKKNATVYAHGSQPTLVPATMSQHHTSGEIATC